MTRCHLTAAAAAAAFGITAMSQGAFAEAHGDMDCASYSAMVEAEQREAIETGRVAARDRMMGDDPDRAAMFDAEDPEELYVFVSEVCAENPEMMVSEAVESRHPTEKTDNE